MIKIEPTDDELRAHLAAVQAMRDDFQRLWLGGLRHAFVTQEAAVWNAYRAGRTATTAPISKASARHSRSGYQHTPTCPYPSLKKSLLLRL